MMDVLQNGTIIYIRHPLINASLTEHHRTIIYAEGWQISGAVN